MAWRSDAGTPLARNAVAARPEHRFIFTDPRTTDGILFEWFAGAQKDVVNLAREADKARRRTHKS